MRRLFFLALVIFFAENNFAQAPEDALRSAWFIPNGTARSNSIGGATGALGGDISSSYTNPAGLGFYKTSEVVITPAFIMNNNKSDYRATSSGNIKSSAFELGTVGVVIGGRNAYANRSSTFSVSVNQLASYNNDIHYEGKNNYSSYSEQYLEELTKDNANIDAASNNYIYGSTLAFYTYLIDSIADPAGNLLGYRSLVPIEDGIMQQYDENDKGGLYEISLGFASNNNDKVYLGASINIPISFFSQDITYKESDVSGNVDNNFDYSTFQQHYSSSGGGLNARFGIIYHLPGSIRLGFAFHTPSINSYTDKLNASITTNTENYAGLQTANSEDFNNGAPGETQYNEITPWRAIASAAYVFKEVPDVKLQKGFISADIEAVNYRGARFSPGSDNGDADASTSDYYDALNSTIKSYYKPAFNFRLGGELKFSPFALRLGGGYYGSPYKDKTLKANRIQAAGGIGYRNHGMFLDVTYAAFFNKDVSFPYRLNDKANTFATLQNQRSNIIVTAGFKF